MESWEKWIDKNVFVRTAEGYKKYGLCIDSTHAYIVLKYFSRDKIVNIPWSDVKTIEEYDGART